MLIDLNSYGFKWTDLYYIDFNISNSYDALKRINSNQEVSLLESRKTLEAKINSIKEENKLLGSDIDAYINHHFYEDDMVINELEKLQRFSLIMSIFSFYESQLKILCNLIEKEFQFKIKLKDLNNYKGDLFRYWTYLDKVYQVPIGNLQPLFNPINQQKSLRNLIAHHNGIVNEDSINKVHKVDGVLFNKVGNLYYIEIEKDIYINYLLKNIKDFFEELLKVVDNRYIELKSV